MVSKYSGHWRSLGARFQNRINLSIQFHGISQKSSNNYSTLINSQKEVSPINSAANFCHLRIFCSRSDSGSIFLQKFQYRQRYSLDRCFSRNNINTASLSVGLNKAVNMDNFPKNFTDSKSFGDFLKDIDAVMFDCDGVLWIGMKTLPNAPDLVKKLRSVGKKVFFMTNNSTKTREEFLVKFNTLGFEATMDEIVSTSFLAALHLKELNFNQKAYVIGTTGVTKELQAVNIKSLPIGPDVVSADMITWAADNLEKSSLDPEVGAVIVGFDHHFSYAKLFKAASYLKNPSCVFIATNTDESFPSGDNMVIPGTGSIVNSVKTAAMRDPIVMGKPSRIPFDYIRRFHSLDSNRVLMVGDRANTDILFGTNCGLHTLLVLSGVTTLEEVQEWAVSGNEEERRCVPKFYAEDVGELHKLLLDS